MTKLYEPEIKNNSAKSYHLWMSLIAVAKINENKTNSKNNKSKSIHSWTKLAD